MKEFLVIYYAPQTAMAKMATMSEEEKMAGMKPWMDWMSKYQGSIVNGGSPLMPGTQKGKNESWHSNNSDVTGYSILKAENLEAAKEICDSHPHNDWSEGCSVAIHECAKM